MSLLRAARRALEPKYMHGSYGGFFHSEALPNALPRKQNSPQFPPYNLYNELISGSAFTAPRENNRYTWMYRLRPTCAYEPLGYEEYKPNGGLWST